jgi:acyl carrier protein
VADTVIDVLKNVSRRPIEPKLSDDLVADLRFDSLDVLAIVAELEDRFGISIPIEEVPARRTVGDVVVRVAALLEEAGAR